MVNFFCPSVDKAVSVKAPGIVGGGKINPGHISLGFQDYIKVEGYWATRLIAGSIIPAGSTASVIVSGWYPNSFDMFTPDGIVRRSGHVVTGKVTVDTDILQSVIDLTGNTITNTLNGAAFPTNNVAGNIDTMSTAEAFSMSFGQTTDGNGRYASVNAFDRWTGNFYVNTGLESGTFTADSIAYESLLQFTNESGVDIAQNTVLAIIVFAQSITTEVGGGGGGM